MTSTDLNAGERPAPATALLSSAAVSSPPAAPVQAGVEATARGWREPRALVGIACLFGILGATALIVVDAASHSSPLVPRQPQISSYLSWIGSELGYQTFLIAVLVITVCYLGVAWSARAVPSRWLIGVVVALHVVLFAGPVLFSQDIFQYIDYGRLGALHGLNPFLNGPSAERHDPIFRYVGLVWHHVPTAYGPVFTLVSYPIALLGLDGSLWGMKLLGVVSSLGALALVWLCAKRLGRDPRPALTLVALNPLWLIYGLGGFHNDLMMDAFMLLGVWFVLRGEEARAGASVMIGAAVKATAVAVLPFMLIAHRRWSVVWGALAALAVIGGVSLLVFGLHPLDFISVVRRDQTFVSSDSFPNEVAHLLGFPGVFRIDRTLLTAVTGFTVLWIMWRTWKGYDWLSGAALTMLLLAVTTTWLLAWYLLWALPLCVLARDRRVMYATVTICILFIAHQTGPLFTPS